MLKKTARDFLEKECPESFVREMEEDDDGHSPELWHKIADLGWLGLVYPEKYGGTGGSFLDLTVLYEETGRSILPTPHLSTVVLCGLTVLAAGSEEQKAELLPKIVKGDLILALALTEPESSWDNKAWDAEGVAVRATRDGDDYIIDGTKLFVHDAHIADYILCVTRTRKGTKPENGITLFLVDAKSPGISCNLLETTAGDKQSEVVFDKVRVPKKNIVGKLNGGWPPLAKVMQQGAVLLCAEMVGAGQRMLELTVEYAKTRIQFEQPIGINQYVQEHCVYLLSEVDSSRWLTYQAAWRLSQGLSCDMEVAIAKAWTSDAHERACWCAHQVHAGVGYTIDAGVLPLYSRRAKSQQLYLGDTAYHLKKVAEQVDNWVAPEKFKGKPLGLWNVPEEEQIPAWQPWKKRWETIQRRKEERENRKAIKR
jgi:alkylation response protein AidB-like acyl-CoA dehydrogenase